MSRRMRGGAIPYLSTSNPSDLSQARVDRRMIPFFKQLGLDTDNKWVSETWYQELPPTAQNYSSATQNFHVDADVECLIDLTKSFFVANITLADGAGPNQNYALSPFAPQLFIKNILTKVNNADLSDSHTNNGDYAYAAIMKQMLLKPRETDTWTAPPVGGSIPGSANGFVTPAIGNESTEASSTMECVGSPWQTPDSAMVVPVLNLYLANTNACYFKNLLTPYSTANGTVATTSTFEMKVTPQDGAWRQPGYLPTGVQLDIQLQIAQPGNVAGGASTAGGVSQFVMSEQGLAAPLYTLNSLNLYLCRVRPRSEALLSINEKLNAAPFTYPFTYSRVEDYLLAAGPSVITQTCFNGGILPNAIMVALVPDAAYTRTQLDSNPLTCGNLCYVGAGNIPQVSSLTAIVGSQQFPREGQVLTNVQQGVIQRDVTATYEEYRKMCLDYNFPFLTYKHWQNHFSIFCINTTSEECPLFASTDEARTGSVTLKISLSAALAQNTRLIIVGIQNASFSVDSKRAVQTTGRI